MQILSVVFGLLKKTTQQFFHHDAPQMAAALSYYALFSIPPILVITLFLLSPFLSSSTAQLTLTQEMEVIFGPGARIPIREVLQQITASSSEGFITQVIGVFALFVAATGLLGHIQKSLNTIWSLSPSRKSLGLMIEQRILGLLFIGLTGLALLVSVIAHAVISSFTPAVTSATGFQYEAIGMLNNFIAFILVICIIALTFRYIPSGKMAWRDIFVGSMVTAILFTLGRMLLAVYLSHTSVGSAYGAAGSIILLLFWIYYSSLIFFFGAELTYVYSTTHGKGFKGEKYSQHGTHETI